MNDSITGAEYARALGLTGDPQGAADLAADLLRRNREENGDPVARLIGAIDMAVEADVYGAKKAKQYVMAALALDTPDIERARAITARLLRRARGPQPMESVQARQPQFLLDPLILREDVNLLSGPGGTGKTRMVLSLLDAIASGGHVMGHPDLPSPKAGRGVLLTGGEERPETLAWMHSQLAADIVEVEDEFTDDEGKLTPYAHWLLSWMLERETPLIILDSISNLYFGNENDRRHVNTFIKQLRQYAYQGPSVVMIGHVSRAHADYSGSTGWSTGVRSHITLTRDENDSDVTVIKLIKANRGRAGQEWRVTNVDAAGKWIPWRMADADVQENGHSDLDDIETLLRVLVQDLGCPRSGAAKPISQAAIAKAMRLRKGDVARLLDSAQTMGRLVAFDGPKNGKEYLVP